MLSICSMAVRDEQYGAVNGFPQTWQPTFIKRKPPREKEKTDYKLGCDWRNGEGNTIALCSQGFVFADTQTHTYFELTQSCRVVTNFTLSCHYMNVCTSYQPAGRSLSLSVSPLPATVVLPGRVCGVRHLAPECGRRLGTLVHVGRVQPDLWGRSVLLHEALWQPSVSRQSKPQQAEHTHPGPASRCVSLSVRASQHGRGMSWGSHWESIQSFLNNYFGVCSIL